MFRLPADVFVVGGETFMQIFYFDIPCFDGTVDERSIGTVAEWVTVSDSCLMNKFSFFFQAFDDVLVAIFAETAGVFWEFIGEIAGHIQRISDDINAGLFCNAEVIFTVCRCNMDETYTIIGAYIVVIENLKCAVCAVFCKIREERFIGPSFEIGTFESGDNFIIFCFFEE